MGFSLVLKPELIVGLIRESVDAVWLHVTAVVARLILGGALLTYSAFSKYPIILEILGWIAIITAMGMGGMGRSNFKALILWALKFTSSYARIGGWVTIFFGVFLVHAVV